jgi:hypothetical protein
MGDLLLCKPSATMDEGTKIKQQKKKTQAKD